jgi:hypothetical protein
MAWVWGFGDELVWQEPEPRTHMHFPSELRDAIKNAYSEVLKSVPLKQSNNIYLGKIEEGTCAYAAQVFVNLEPIGFIRARRGYPIGEVDVCCVPVWRAYWSGWDTLESLEEL